MLGKLRHIHFVGIGGVGMSGLALILKNLGFIVTGSDISHSPIIDNLKANGITIFSKHQSQNIEGADVVVYSSAIPKDNPEINVALKKGLPVIPRAEMLAELMRMKYSIAISGTHGKTTVTSLIASILEECGLEPTVVIGGKVVGMQTGAKLGKSEYLVAEADESDRSFLLLFPTIVVVTNIEREHLDCYANLSEIKKAFVEFINKVPFYGSAILCTDCPNVKQILSKIKRNYITYGIKSQAMVRAENIKLNRFTSQFTVCYNGQSKKVKINLAGWHNVQNALAAICVGLKLELSLTKIVKALAKFPGVHRRLELKGQIQDITLLDDYGHHPTEIKVTLQALRNAYPNNRIIAVFQPHRYTRTQALAKEFGYCFDFVDKLIITQIYPASEPPIPKVTSKLIINAVRNHNPKIEIFYKRNLNEIPDFLMKLVKARDVIITLGAGNIWQVGEKLLSCLHNAKLLRTSTKDEACTSHRKKISVCPV